MNHLKEQLTSAYPYRIELHAHTNPVSSCSELPPAEVVRRYHALGAHGVVITNHAKPDATNKPQEEWAQWYCKDYREAVAEGEKLGVRVYLGMEACFPQNNNDYLVYGVDEAFVKQAWEYLGTDLHTFHEACKAENRVIVQAHPFRKGMALADAADLDGIEVFNMHPGHNSCIAFAARHQVTVGGIVTAGTDFHHPDHEGMVFACFKKLPADSFELAQLLRSGDYVFTVGNSLILP